MRADIAGMSVLSGRADSCRSPSHSGDDVDPRALFVGGLGDTMTADDLRCIFMDADGAVRPRILIDAEGRSKRCGFVHFSTVAACQEQLRRIKNGCIEYAGCRLRIEPKQRRRPAGGCSC
jgi:RNA recognition motif-containing protein